MLFSSLYVQSVSAETTSMRENTVSRFSLGYQRPAHTSRGYNPNAYGTLAPGRVSTNVPTELRSEYAKLKEFYTAKKRKEKYVFVNKYNKRAGNFLTYVLNMETGKVEDKFVSLIGYRGFGCGKGQTRPGIFRLSSAKGRGASRKAHWGNNHAYHVIANINGHSRRWGGMNCGQSYQHVAHSNKYITKNSSYNRRRRRSSKSAGCFVTSPEMFTKWTTKIAGNALIYNVKP